MFETSIAGSLPKPAWLADTNTLWPQWQAEGQALRQAKADATLLWIKAQEDAGLDIVCDGEQSRQHCVPGFLEQVEGIDQVSLECLHSHVPPDLMQLLAGKDVMAGVIDVASDVVETPEEVADTIARALEFVPKERLFPAPTEAWHP